jgi:predicted dehydrogenase
MTPNEPLEVGIVGLGTRGLSLAERLDDMGISFVGTEINQQAAAVFETRFDGRIYQTPAEMYESDLDAVLISTPNKFHESAAVAALDRGLDILIEKPLAHTVDSAERIVAAARESEGQCFVGFDRRFSDTVQTLRAYANEGRFGDVTHVEARYVRRRGIPSFGTWYTSKAIAGGGALIDIGVHVIDLILHLYGFPDVETVAGTTRREFGDHDDYAAALNLWKNEANSRMFDVEDSATAFIEFAGGRTASIEVAWAANCAEAVSHRYRVRGTDGGADLHIPSGTDREHELSVFETSTSGRPHFVDETVDTTHRDATALQLAAFRDAIRTGESGHLATDEEALATQRVVGRLYDD